VSEAGGASEAVTGVAGPELEPEPEVGASGPVERGRDDEDAATGGGLKGADMCGGGLEKLSLVSRRSCWSTCDHNKRIHSA
jgi:hypothetical protein